MGDADHSRREFVAYGSLLGVASLFRTPLPVKPRPERGRALGAVHLEAVRFSLDGARALQGAIMSRRNSSDTATGPEWTRAAARAAHLRGAVYPLQRFTAQPITIEAQFVSDDASLQNIEVQAIDVGGSSILGAVAPTRVALAPVTGAASPNGQFVQLQLAGHLLRQKGVGIYQVEWLWQWRSQPAASWTDIDRSAHTIYVIVNEPTRPWVPRASSNASRTGAIIWTDVLDCSCRWAQGAADEPTAAAAVARGLNEVAGFEVTLPSGRPARMEYDEGANYTDASSSLFRCEDFLELLARQPRLAPQVNCRDCAAAVVTFANALGSDLDIVRLGAPGDKERFGFNLNTYWLIGRSQPEVPVPPQYYGGSISDYPRPIIQGSLSDSPDLHGGCVNLCSHFSWHAVAWSGPMDASGLVYDACLRLDMGPTPSWDDSTPDWHVPVGLRFGTASDTGTSIGYLQRLTAPGSRSFCSPFERSRPTVTSSAPVTLAALGEPRRLIDSGRAGTPVMTTHTKLIKQLAQQSAKWRVTRPDARKETRLLSRQGDSITFSESEVVSVNGDSVVFGLSVVDLSSADAARQFLQHLLAEYQRTPQPLDGGLVDKGAFGSADYTTVLVTQGRSVIRIRNLGIERAPALSLARTVRYLIRRTDTPDPVRQDRFYLNMDSLMSSIGGASGHHTR